MWDNISQMNNDSATVRDHATVPKGGRGKTVSHYGLNLQCQGDYATVPEGKRVGDKIYAKRTMSATVPQ